MAVATALAILSVLFYVVLQHRLVKPGERLFIVKGIEAWKHAQHTIRRHGG